MYDNGVTIAAGSPHDDDCGYARVFSYSSTTTKSNLLGNTLVGAVSSGYF